MTRIKDPDGILKESKFTLDSINLSFFLFEHLQGMCNLGLRETMSFFANYGWVSDLETPDLIGPVSRFIHQYPVVEFRKIQFIFWIISIVDLSGCAMINKSDHLISCPVKDQGIK